MYKIKDRSAKVAKRKARMPVHGQSMKALLTDRAARIIAERKPR